MARHALLKVLLMPDSERAALVGGLGSNPPSRSAADSSAAPWWRRRSTDSRTS
jgi:hypothetical protein